MRRLDINAVAKRIKWPVAQWAGNCYALACILVKLKVVKGTPVYGHYTGEVHPKSILKAKMSIGFVQHGWIMTADGTIIDPTRWVFTNPSKPEIYVGPNNGEYDEGGNMLRTALLQPPPAYDAKPSWGKDYEVKRCTRFKYASVEVLDHVRSLFGGLLPKDGVPSEIQLFWLANLPLSMLGEHAHAIYQDITTAGRPAFIPIDNRRAVERKYGKLVDPEDS